MEIIPEQCLSLLPFVPEPVSSWSQRTDLLGFLRALFNKGGTIVEESGARHEINYASYGNSLYKWGKRDFRVIAKQFLRNARAHVPAPGAKGNVDPIPAEFSKDNNFGLMAKYHIAWNGIVNEVLSESAYFSIAHVLESREELDCSVLLASNLHYKQALQVLRNFLEGVVLQPYFCDNESAFKAWKTNQFKVLFRGRNGVLESLRSRSVISQRLADTASALYGELNSAIHGAESRLINRGIFTGKWHGLIFSQDRFEEWCMYFSRSVGLAIPLMREHLNVWHRIRAEHPKGIRCDICHNADDFDREKVDFGGTAHTHIRCRRCGHSMDFNDSMAE